MCPSNSNSTSSIVASTHPLSSCQSSEIQSIPAAPSPSPKSTSEKFGLLQPHSKNNNSASSITRRNSFPVIDKNPPKNDDIVIDIPPLCDDSIELLKNDNIKYDENTQYYYNAFNKLCNVSTELHGEKIDSNLIIPLMLSIIKGENTLQNYTYSAPEITPEENTKPNSPPGKIGKAKEKVKSFFEKRKTEEQKEEEKKIAQEKEEKAAEEKNKQEEFETKVFNDPKKCLQEIKISSNSVDKIKVDSELHAKLVAAELLKMATKKEFTPGPFFGSIAASLATGIAFDVALMPMAKKALFGDNFSPTKYAFAAAGIDSVPSFVCEGIDTLFVQAMIKTMNKESWEFKELIPNAIKGGAVAAAGAYFNNLLQYKSTGSHAADLALNVATTETAIMSAASGVPMEVKESEAKMNAALEKAINEGLLNRKPEDVDMPKYIERVSKQARDIAPGDSIAQKSITFAAIMGILPLILGEKVTGWVPEKYLGPLRITLFNPIEAIAMTSLVATSKVGGPFALLTSDDQKHEQLFKLIIEKSGKIGDDARITDEELEAIFHPKIERAFQDVGNGIINVLSSLFSAVPNLVGKALNAAKGDTENANAENNVEHDLELGQRQQTNTTPFQSNLHTPGSYPQS